MTIFYLQPIPLPSTQQVDDLAFVFEKGRVERSLHTTLTFGKVEVQVEGTVLHRWCEYFYQPPSSLPRNRERW
jgi:hypothetical protein